MLETISSTEIIPARLRSPLSNLETLYIPWFLSGMGGMGLNHSIYTRCVGTRTACKASGDEKIFKSAEGGI